MGAAPAVPADGTARASVPRRLAAWFVRCTPWLILSFLSIDLAELLTGSTSVRTALTNPLSVPVLLGYYGAGVVAIREVCLRWRKGWGSVLLLGLAYGILEEAIGTKTFFDPHSPPVGYLGIFGHWLGVNWVWAVLLTLFHSLYSIAIPILLFHLAFPQYRGRRFFSDRGLVATAAILVATVGATSPFFDPNHYWEGWGLVLAALAVMLLLALSAWRAPADLLTPWREGPTWSARRLLGLGLFFSFAFFLVAYSLPRLLPVPAGIVVLEVAVVLGTLLVLLRNVGRRRAASGVVAFAAGSLGFQFLLDVVLEFRPAEAGILAIPAIDAAVLVWLWRRMRSEESAAPGTSANVGAA